MFTVNSANKRQKTCSTVHQVSYIQKAEHILQSMQDTTKNIHPLQKNYGMLSNNDMKYKMIVISECRNFYNKDYIHFAARAICPLRLSQYINAVIVCYKR